MWDASGFYGIECFVNKKIPEVGDLWTYHDPAGPLVSLNNIIPEEKIIVTYRKNDA